MLDVNIDSLVFIDNFDIAVDSKYSEDEVESQR